MTTAYRLLATETSSEDSPLDVTVVEAEDTLGGKIRTSAFVGMPIDEGPDAYLARVPHGVQLTRELGLGDDITHPETGHAAVWHRRLHRIPAGLVLGIPTGSAALARSGLLSTRATVRAALEPILPTSGDPGDSVGVFVRRRFGRDVQELLVDPLIGSIYAADTMNFSLDMVPQLADLAHHRSVLWAARRHIRGSSVSTTPVFESPRSGLGTLVGALRSRIESLGGRVLTARRAETIESSGRDAHSGRPMYTVTTSNGDALPADAVILCSPARTSAPLLESLDSSVASAMAMWTHASVVIVTINATSDRSERLAGLSGYLVPKPDQDRVTAVSFGSHKWRHWQPDDGSMILRVSLGRDGAPTEDLIHDWDDDRLLRQCLDEVSRHTGALFHPQSVRVSRWPESFPQYRPGHKARVAALESSLRTSAPGVFLAGASWHGIGLPACIADANHIAGVTGQYFSEM